jgi:hypothetical protein
VKVHYAPTIPRCETIDPQAQQPEPIGHPLIYVFSRNDDFGGLFPDFFKNFIKARMVKFRDIRGVWISLSPVLYNAEKLAEGVRHQCKSPQDL